MTLQKICNPSGRSRAHCLRDVCRWKLGRPAARQRLRSRRCGAGVVPCSRPICTLREQVSASAEVPEDAKPTRARNMPRCAYRRINDLRCTVPLAIGVRQLLTRPYACLPLGYARFPSRSSGKDYCERAANSASPHVERSVVVHADQASYLEVREVRREKESPNNHDSYITDLQCWLKRDAWSNPSLQFRTVHAISRHCAAVHQFTNASEKGQRTHGALSTPDEDPNAFLYI